MRFEDIAKMVNPEDEIFFYDPEDGIAAILDMESHIKHLFKYSEGSFKEVKLDIKGMAQKLRAGFETQDFLEEVLETTAPATLLEVNDRLEHPEAKVTSAPRCFSLMIGGKRGRPLELTLRR